MRVLAYTIKTLDTGDITINESTGQSITSGNIEQLLDWLMDDYTETPDKLLVTWDLADFAAPLLRKLGKECCEQIAGDQHRTKLFKPYTVFFRYRTESGGVLGIDKGFKRYTASIYSLSQFFSKDTPEPETAEEVQAYGDDLIQSLEGIGIKPTKLTSPIAAYLSCAKFPVSSKDVTASEALAGEYAFNCTSREWRDCFQVGVWEEGECFDYDMINAYSAIAAHLLDTSQADILYSRDYVEDAHWGFLKGRVTINDDVLVSPIMHEMANGALGTPVGTWDTYLTYGEVKFINRWGIGHFELEDGWFIRFKKAVKPLRETMIRLYADRKEADNPILSRFLKGVANGMIGKFLETHDDGTVGEYYNPIWHAEVTSATRLKVAEFIYQNQAQDNTIAINTDGCMVDRELPTVDNPGLGQWRLEGVHPSIALSPGLIFTADKKPQGINYATLRQMINDNPKESEYRHYRQRHTTLAEAVEGGDITQVGEINTFAGTVNLPSIAEGSTRRFVEYPMTGSKLLEKKYKSTPININD